MKSIGTKVERVINYASRSRKEEGTVFPSTEAQMIQLDADAEMKGQIVVARFMEEGWSGKSLRGPKMMAALQMLENGEADVLKVTRMNRMVRNQRKFWELADKLERWGARVEPLEGNWDFDTAKGRLIARIMLSFDEYISEEAGELFSLKNKQRVIDRGLHVGPPPFGYRIRMIPDPRNPGALISSGEFVIDQAEADAILQLTEWLQETGDPAFVLDLAKQQGMVRPRRHSPDKDPGNWTRGSLQYVLTNPVLSGKLKYKGELHPGLHEAILTEDQIEKNTLVFERDKGRAGKGSKDSYPYLLGLRLWYREATAEGTRYDQYYGYPSTKLSPDGTPYRYYRRNSSHRRHYTDSVRPKGDKVHLGQIKVEHLEGEVIKQLREFTLDESAWNGWHYSIVRTAEEGLIRVEQTAERLEKDLAAFKAKRGMLRERLLDPALAASALTVKELHDMIAENNQLLDATEVSLLQAARLGEWYKRLPTEASHIRGTFIATLKAYDKGQRRVAQGMLRDILQEPYGVVLSEEGIEINLRPGLYLEREAAKFDIVEENWAILDSNQ